MLERQADPELTPAQMIACDGPECKVEWVRTLYLLTKSRSRDPCTVPPRMCWTQGCAARQVLL